MLFCRYILLICVFLICLGGFDAVDVFGFQIVKFRKNDTINNMSVVLRNIPRSSIMARLYVKKYESKFTYNIVNVTGSEAVFENFDFHLDSLVGGRLLQSTVILQNKTEYGDREVMKLEFIEYLTEDDRDEVKHPCLQSCTIIIDYHETPSASNDTKDIPPSSSPILDIYPNTSIIYKANSNHNISCIGDNATFDFDIRLYQIKKDGYHIRANTTSNVLTAVLNLTEQDNGTSLQCYILWKYFTKATKTIDLLLNGTSDEKSAQDERNAVGTVVPSLKTSAKTESYWKNIGLATTTIVIIILLIIIIFITIDGQRRKSKEFPRSDCISSHSVNIRCVSGLKTNDYTTELQTSNELWRNNEYYVNENYNIGSNYYSYATNH